MLRVDSTSRLLEQALPTSSSTSVPVTATVAAFIAPAAPLKDSSSPGRKELLLAAKERRRTWSEVQELRQVSQTWAASCMVQPAVRMKLFKEDQQRLNEEALNRWHQQLEGLTLCCGLICLAYLGYHVEPRWPRYWSAYSVGALSSLASGLLGLALEAHRPKETRQYSVGGIQLIAGLVMALVMPILNSVGMPLAQLAAHHFIASSTLSRLVAGSNTARSFASYIALNLWLGAFICQLSWLMVAPTPFVVVLELVMGGLMAVIPASEVDTDG